MALVASAFSHPVAPKTCSNEKSVFFCVDHQNVCLNVSSEATIQEIKIQLVQKLAQKTLQSSNVLLQFWGMLWLTKTANDLFLVYNGKPLDEDLLVSDYHLPSNCTVHVNGKHRGGCFMISFTVLCLIITAIIGSTCTCGVSLIAVPFLLPLLFVLPLFCL